LRVGLPFESFIGPGIPDILAQNDLRLAAAFGDFLACLADTGGFRFMPCAFADARPLAFNPPLGFLPFFSLPCRSLWHYLAALILSIRLGYLRPAFFAAAFALAFCAGVSFLDLPNDFGLGFSQTGLALFLFATLFLSCWNIFLFSCSRYCWVFWIAWHYLVNTLAALKLEIVTEPLV